MSRASAAWRKYRIVLASMVALTAVVAVSASVSAQWPTACVALNDIVEQHLGNDGNVGIYQRTFGEQAEEACRRDHVDDLRAVFGWAFGPSPTPGSADDQAISDIGGWPTTCVELNDIVERHLGNDHNVGIYQRAWQDRAESGCQTDHRADVRSTFAWAQPRTEPGPPPRTPTDPLLPTVGDLAGDSPVLRAFLSDLPWLADYVYPWLTDGVTQDEIDFLSTLRPTAEVNEALAMFIAGTAWFESGIDHSDDFRNEEFAPELLRTIYQTSPQYLDIATTYYWVSDDITARELSALKDINELAKRDHDLALRLAGAPWVQDGIRPFEIYALDSLPILYDRNPSLTRQLAEPATADVVWASDIRLIDIMTNMFTNYGEDDQPKESSRFHRLATQPWFADGLDAEERAFINALDMVFDDDALFDRLLRERYAQTATLSLPLAGPVRLWAFQAEPFPEGENVLSQVAAGLIGFERIMQAAPPANDIVVLLRGHTSGMGHDGRMRLPRHPLVPLTTDLILDAIGEAYFTFKMGPRYPEPRHGQFALPWMQVGGHEFAKAYVHNWLGTRDLYAQNHTWSIDARNDCASKGLRNIYSVSIQPYPKEREAARELERCGSLYGSMLLFSLFVTLGERAVSLALRDLYIPTVHDEVRRNPEGHLTPTNLDILRAFMRHAPAHQHDQIRHWFRQLHGGPFVDAVT
ncbi:MAG: hypothetical protein OXG65_06555 [Chloroflexi bacterium]|nr:hypothetical protein [Chloroflexota bacterium]